MRCTHFVLSHGFVPLGFPGKVFNEAAFPKRINNMDIQEGVLWIIISGCPYNP